MKLLFRLLFRREFCEKISDYSSGPKKIVLLESDLVEKFVKGGGPGGQSINKTSNKVVLHHVPSGISVQCQEYRELAANRKTARRLLEEKLSFLEYGAESKRGRRIEKIRRNKSKQASRAKKKYGNVSTDDSNDDDDDDNGDNIGANEGVK